MSKNEKRLKRILDSVPAYVYWKDTMGVYMGCNKAHAELAGFDNIDSIIGKTDYDMAWSDSAEEVRKLDALVIEKNTEITAEEKSSFNIDGKEVFFLSKKMPLYNASGKIDGIIGVSIDITEKKQLERALEAKNTELEGVLSKYRDFIANQEHDIRTPISCVMGIAQALMDNLSDDPENHKLAHLIFESAKAQKAYHNSILDGIYLFEHQTETITRRFSLKKLVKEVELIYACAFQENELQFKLFYDDKIPRFLWGDWFRLEQILVALLSNAVKFTETGDEILLRCQLDGHKENKVILSIEIEDTGLGIEGDKLNTIFEPFVRLSLSNLGKYSGRGLGLTFVKKMVAELEGEINVRSVVGVGSVFHLLLPFEASLSNTPTSEPKGKSEI